jgi:hypothetical protein
MGTQPASDNVFPLVRLSEGAAPATPPAGEAHLYVKADGLLYWKDDAGTEYPVGGDIAAHLADASDAHDASAVSLADAGGLYAATEVEAALAEIGAHPGDSSAAHAASAVSIVDAGAYFTGTEVEAALQELGAGGGGGGGLTQAYVGYNTAGGTIESWTANRVFAKKITLANDALITDIEAYVDQGGGDDSVADMMVALFEDNAGTPRYLLSHQHNPTQAAHVLDTTSGGGGHQNPRWLGLPIGRWCPAGDYWIAAMATSSRMRIYKDASGSDRYYTATGTWLADWGFYAATTTTDRYSIRANTIR